ncbi:MAG TPA: ExeM/NucH family extracellular endonuclease, partial [Ornithinicoccus sp.]|nr:ExeM/NucH family extracellular endonuclease [Ornithinicoccus sp.]
DAVVLRKGDEVVDSIGQVGFDPGTEWGAGLTSTADNTLRRKDTVTTGDTVIDDVFDPAVEWDGYPVDTFDGLGSHGPSCLVSEDLLLSEYVEGSSNNKALEFYNGTGEPIDLAAGGYKVQQYSNGGTSAGITINLTGTVAPGEVFVLAHASSVPAILDEADQTVNLGLFNGNDAVVLRKGDEVVDSIGQVGFDPGTEWGAGLTSTADNTLRRKDTVTTGDTVIDDVFDPAVEWDGYPVDTFDGLGSHAGCGGDGGGDDEEPLPDGDCGDPVTAIGVIQGTGDASPLVGETRTIEGVVVGDFDNEFDGFWVQDAGDGDPATSDGIFVYDPDGSPDVSVGDRVRVTGTVGENFTVTQLRNVDVAVCAEGVALPEPAVLTIPSDDSDKERVESMRVRLPQELTILEYFDYDRYGEIVLGTDRQYQPTAVHEPASPEAEALRDANAANRILLDDGRSNQNPSPAMHPNGEEFTLTNYFRGGDILTNVTGVLDYRFSTWRIQPTEGADYTAANPRPDVPEVGGDVTVASFNVLNYFTTLAGDGGRGADTPEEFDRQEAKIVAALAELDADIVGLIEIENNGDTALGTLTAALNEELGGEVYSYISTGQVGTDAITTAFIYKKDTVEPVGDFALLTEAIDPDFNTERNRPALAQTFQPVAGGEMVTVAVNHLKSKGSGCPEDGDGSEPADPWQGNCNATRERAAAALAGWMNDDPTGTGSENAVIIGDLNSYDKEDPIDALTAGGFVDLLLEHQGEYAYSYVFDGMLGYLDYGLANQAAAELVTGADVWRINADEVDLIDYDMSFKAPREDELFAPDPYRSSDHDPVVIGLDLSGDAADTTAPELEVTVDTPEIWPPNNKWRTVRTTVEASDDSGEVTVELVGITVSGVKGAGAEVVSDTEFKVKAVKNAVYTITYEATDPSGNSTTRSVEVVVPHDRGKGGKK